MGRVYTAGGDPFCFEYGPVNESDDGPVEIGLPFEGEIEPSGEMRVVQIPAHRAEVGQHIPPQAAYN